MLVPQVEGMKKMETGDSIEESGHDRAQVMPLGVYCRYEIESVHLVTEIREKNEGTSSGASTLEFSGNDSSATRGNASTLSGVGDIDPDRVRYFYSTQNIGSRENRVEGGIQHPESDLYPLGTREVPRINGSQSGYPLFSQPEPALSSDKMGEAYIVDTSVREVSKVDDVHNMKRFSMDRSTGNFSAESSSGDQCRICQQHTDEALMELGCHCRGELANAHRTCIDRWFGNKGSNKCEVCQHVASNVPQPASQPTPHFWVWRAGGGAFNSAASRRTGARFHPLWAALLILIAGLLFDILISIFLGASALPVNIIIGVLVVLGLGTAARLVLECWHERAIRRNIQRMEEEPNFEELSAEQNNVNIWIDRTEAQSSSNVPVLSLPVQSNAGRA